MSIPKGASFENLGTAINKIKQDYAKKTDIPTKVTDITNDAGFQTGAQVESAINAKVASTYKAGGSVAFAALPTPDEAHLGFVYNVTDKFTTTDAFVEGAGSKNAAGTNVAIVAVTDGETTVYKYDVLAGFVDLAGYAEKETVTADISTAKTEAINQANAATDEKLEAYVKGTDIEFATEAEVLALFADETENS